MFYSRARSKPRIHSIIHSPRVLLAEEVSSLLLAGTAVDPQQRRQLHSQATLFIHEGSVELTDGSKKSEESSEFYGN